MPIVLTPIESAGATDWIDTEEADIYFATRHGIGTLWSDLDAQAKAALLITAQMPIELSTDYEFQEEVTERMKNAVCEQAIFMLLDPDLELRAALQVQGVIEAGIVMEKYREASTGGLVLAPRVKVLLKSLSNDNNHEIRLVR